MTDQPKRCGTCVHWNGIDGATAVGDCPFLPFKRAASDLCSVDRWFSMDQLRAPTYGKKPKTPDLFA